MRKLIALFILSILLTGCFKDKYENDFSDLVYSPEVALPLLKSNVVADDLLNNIDSTLLREGPDKLLEFVYTDSIYSLSLEEFVDIPDESVNYKFNLEPIFLDDVPEFSTSISIDTVAENAGDPFKAAFLLVKNSCANPFPAYGPVNAGDIDISIPNAPFETATFSEGVLRLELENNWKTTITNVELAVKRNSDGVAIDTLRYASIPPNTSLADSILMAGKTIEDEMIAEFISMSSPGTAGNVCVDGKDSIVATVSAYDLVVIAGTATIPSQEVFDDTVDVDVSLTNGEQLETLVLKNGDLSFDLNYEVAEASKLYISLPYVTLGGVPFYDSIAVVAGPTVINETFDLSGYRFDLTKNGTTYNGIEAVIKASLVSSGTPVPFDTANVVEADVTFSNIQPQFIDGYFGNQTLSLDRDTNDFDIGSYDILENFSFADPEVNITFDNTFGIPMTISTLDLIMKKDPEEITLQNAPIPFQIQSGNIGNPGTAVQSVLTLDAGTTNIEDAINIWPNEVISGFSGSINSSGNTYNYALDTSKLDVSIDLVVPLYGTISNFVFLDTIEIDTAMAEVFADVVNASLRSNVNNGFPLEGKVDFYLTDENYVYLDSLKSKSGTQVLVQAATVNPSNGNVVSNGVKQDDLIADENDVMILQNAGNKIIIKVTFDTANAGNNVKIYSNQTMDIKLGLRAKLNVELNQDEQN